MEGQQSHHYLAVDLGAESGRVMLGTLSGWPDRRIDLEEVHRFANSGVSVRGSLRWDLLNLFKEVKAGLRKAAGMGHAIAGISTDAWGVDYVLMRENEPMLTLPFHYRDARTEGSMEKVFAKVPADDIFAETGIQFMTINTLYQMYMDSQNRPETLQMAERFLNVGDYFNYLLCGVPKGEVTLASTTQLFNPSKGDWAWDLIGRMGLPKKMFPALVPAGTKLGALSEDIAERTHLNQAQVIATCSHDTAAAVAAIPGQGQDWAFLSSGTWSLIGAEIPAPVINAASRKYNFTNEMGYNNTVMFRKNIVGLWIVQECKRAWAEGGKDFGYDELTFLAEQAAPLRSLIRPEDSRFGKPGHMPKKIADYCRESGQPVPEGPGAMIRCTLESLAILYGRTLAQCAEVTGRKFKTLHIVGGGSKNNLLNQFTANAVQLPVLTGPVEGSAIGNLLVQARTLGHVDGDIRSVVRQSFHLGTFAPGDPGPWHAAGRRFDALPVT